HKEIVLVPVDTDPEETLTNFSDHETSLYPISGTTKHIITDILEDMFEILPIPAFQDNYIWLIRNGQYAAVVDPGEAAPVIQLIKKHKLILEAIFVTHHHNDHIGGIPALLSEFEPKVYAPSDRKSVV